MADLGASLVGLAATLVPMVLVAFEHRLASTGTSSSTYMTHMEVKLADCNGGKLRLLNLFRNTARDLSTPHVPVGTGLTAALSLLKSCADEVLALEGDQGAYRASAKGWELIIHTDSDEVNAVWYNDESGRRSSESKLAKIHRYLSRYGALTDWELRLDNGWMRYWFNPRAGVMMVYGVHKDVIRFNKYDGE